MLPTAVLANIIEIMGWGARLWSSKNPPLLDPFLMQYAASCPVFPALSEPGFSHRISTTIMAPTPLVAANFVILG